MKPQNSEAAKRAKRKYQAKQKSLMATIYPADYDLLPHIEARKKQFGSGSAYVKALIRADMNGELLP